LLVRGRVAWIGVVRLQLRALGERLLVGRSLGLERMALAPQSLLWGALLGLAWTLRRTFLRRPWELSSPLIDWRGSQKYVTRDRTRAIRDVPSVGVAARKGLGLESASHDERAGLWCHAEALAR
jgi:hypothetical protein